MTNTFRNRQYGAATLITTIILISVSTMIVIFAAKYGVMQQKSNSNFLRNNQAFQAAEAGLEYGITHLQTNSATILASPSGGYIQPYTNSSITNVALGNGARFTVVYTNPVANNYTRIRVTSTGTSDDNTASKSMSQDVQQGSVLMNPPDVPLVSKGEVEMGGNSTVRNLYTSSTIQAGDEVEIEGSAQTVLNSGQSSNASLIKSDVVDEISSIAALSNSDFFTSYFGTNSNTVKNSADFYYNNSSNTNYSATLNGKTGSIIWIDQTAGTAQIRGNTVIGTAANPVLLIVNGSIDLSGGVVINGFVFVTGSASTDIIGNVTINGGIVIGGDTSIRGSATINYEPDIINTLRQSPAMMYYAKIPGTWKDF